MRPSSPDTLLLSAAQRVLAEAMRRDRPADWTLAADELASLTLAIQAGMASEVAQVEEPAGLRIRQSLLTRLEAEVLKEEENGEAHGSPGPTEVVEALDRVREALESGGALDTESHFAGPHGAELVAEIAHDLRSPLTSILTLAETLQRGQSGEVNNVQRRQLGLIYSAALALSSTASNLIELAHGGDRLAQKEPSPFSIAEIFQSVRDIAYPMADEKDLSLRLRADVADWRLGYPLALSRVLLNLTANALQFTDEGFVEIAAVSAGPSKVEFSVRDTGRGVDPTSSETLYQPFRRGSGDGRYVFSGTGLGLAICRRLVEAMDSELRFETQSGWGTRFYFELGLPAAGEHS